MDYLYTVFGNFNIIQSVIFGIVMFMVYAVGQWVAINSIMQKIYNFYDMKQNQNDHEHKTKLILYITKGITYVSKD